MTCNFFKKRPQHRCFPVEFVKLSRTVVVASENRQHITDLKIFVQGNEFVVVLKNLKLGAATFSLVFSASMQQFACCYFKESFYLVLYLLAPSCLHFNDYNLTCLFLFSTWPRSSFDPGVWNIILYFANYKVNCFIVIVKLQIMQKMWSSYFPKINLILTLYYSTLYPHSQGLMQDQNLSAKKNEELQFLHKTFLFYVLSRQTYFFRKRNYF